MSWIYWELGTKNSFYLLILYIKIINAVVYKIFSHYHNWTFIELSCEVDDIRFTNEGSQAQRVCDTTIHGCYNLLVTIYWALIKCLALY